MPNSWRGVTGGFVATVVLSAIMLLNLVPPQLNFVTLIDSLGSIGRGGAWADHFIVGSLVWGLLFAAVDSLTSRGAPWLKGVLFGVGAWVLMMVIFMPVVGAGLFGLKFGMTAPVVMLILHLIYGLVLGTTYGLLASWIRVDDRAKSQQTQAPSRH